MFCQEIAHLGGHFEAEKRASDALFPLNNAKNKRDRLLSGRLLVCR